MYFGCFLLIFFLIFPGDCLGDFLGSLLNDSSIEMIANNVLVFSDIDLVG